MSEEFSINTPTPDVIQSWNDLNEMPLLEVVPNSTPNSIFVSFPNEGYYHHHTYSRTALSASKNVLTIQKLIKVIENADISISKLFKRRSLSKALLAYVERAETIPPQETQEHKQGRLARAAALRSAAKPHFDELFELVTSTMSCANEITSALASVLRADAQWNEGMVSSSLVRYFCLLYFKMVTLDELHLVKSSLSNDFSVFISYMSSGLDNPPEPHTKLRQWLSTEFSIESMLLTQVEMMTEEQKKTVFNYLWETITYLIDNSLYLNPEFLFAYLRTLIFLIRFSKPDSKNESQIKSYLLKQASLHPLIPLCFEMSQRFEDLIKKSHIFSDFSSKTFDFDFITLRNDLLKKINDFPTQVSRAKTGELKSKDFFNIVTQIVQTVGITKNSIREQYVNKLLNPPPDEAIKSPFERSLRKGYNKGDIQILLQLVTMWRTLHDLLRENSDTISRASSDYIGVSLQTLIREVFDSALSNSKKNKDILEQVLGSIRSIVSAEDIKRKKTNTTDLKAPPPPALIELVRIQIEHILNNNSPFMKSSSGTFGSKNKSLNDKDMASFKKFLTDSTHFEDILVFHQLLNNLGDQSDLYFKEVQLDVNRVVCFPIRASLPFVLCEFALGNDVGPDITELVFYPLAIYDDAANIATNVLKSKIIYDEIKAEADICLKTLSILISTFTFGSFRIFSSLKYVNKEVLSSFSIDQRTLPESRAYRLTSMIQQNTFYLHLKLIDVRSIILNAVELQLSLSVEALVNVLKKFGVISSIACSKGLDILKETRRLLCEQGIALTPFDILLRKAIGSGSPSSFLSPLVSSFIQNLLHDVLKKSALRNNPIRLVPSRFKGLPSTPFGEHTLGRLLKGLLDLTTTVLTIEHISFAFQYLDSGSISFLISEITKGFDNNLVSFIKQYTSIIQRVKRIRDVSMNTPGPLTFDRYEGAYTYFAYDKEVMEIFNSMKLIGNTLALSLMIDVYLLHRSMTRHQVAGYFKGIDPLGNYDSKFLDKTGLSNLLQPVLFAKDDSPSSKDTHPPLFTSLLLLMKKIVEENSTVFEEKSSTVLDFGTLTGFASVWSVLEFVFCLIETIRASDEQSPFQKFGEGVFLFAGSLMCITNQHNLHYATNIGRRLERLKDVDFASANDEKLARFCSIYSLEKTSLSLAISIVKPILDNKCP